MEFLTPKKTRLARQRKQRQREREKKLKTDLARTLDNSGILRETSASSANNSSTDFELTFGLDVFASTPVSKPTCSNTSQPNQDEQQSGCSHWGSQLQPSTTAVSDAANLLDTWEQEFSGASGSNEWVDIDPDDSPSSSGSSTTQGTYSESSDASSITGSDMEADGPTDRSRNGAWLANELAGIKCRTGISDSAISQLVKMFVDNAEDVVKLKTNRVITNHYRHGIKPKAKIHIPKILCDLKLKEFGHPAEEAFFKRNLTTIPEQYLKGTGRNSHLILRQDAYTTLTEIKKHFRRTHPRLTRSERRKAHRKAKLGVDGVRETKNGKRTLIIISIMLRNCIFPWRIMNPLKNTRGAKPTLEELYRPIVDEANNDSDIIFRKVIADMLERMQAKGLRGHNAKDSCEMCKGRAAAQGRSKIDWIYPQSTRAPLRTNQRFRKFARLVRDGRSSNKKGIIKYSPLLDLGYPFDIVYDIPLDEFHLLREGLMKKMISLIYGSSTREDRRIQDEFDIEFCNMRVFSETPRATRTLKQMGFLKGTEFGLLLLSAMPTLFEDVMDPDNGDYWREARRCLAAFTFISRSYYYDNATLAEVQTKVDFNKLHQAFQRSFDTCFCKYYNKGVNPNAHAFWHLHASRLRNGPLLENSTEPWEAYYNKLLRGAWKGTRNVPKQMMESFYTSDMLKHRCRGAFKLKLRPDNGNDSKCDAYITCLDGSWWEIKDVLDTEGHTFLCNRILTETYKSDVKLRSVDELPWDLIGVKRFLGVDEEDQQLVHRSDIRGKLMRCGKFMSEWLSSWCRDSKIDY